MAEICDISLQGFHREPAPRTKRESLRSATGGLTLFFCDEMRYVIEIGSGGGT